MLVKGATGITCKPEAAYCGLKKPAMLFWNLGYLFVILMCFSDTVLLMCTLVAEGPIEMSLQKINHAFLTIVNILISTG